MASPLDPVFDRATLSQRLDARQDAQREVAHLRLASLATIDPGAAIRAFEGAYRLARATRPALTRPDPARRLRRRGPLVDGLLAAFEPRIADARAFALQRRVLLLRWDAAVDIDVASGALPFEVSVVERGTLVELLPSRAVRQCTPDDLLVLKAVADRPRDWLDIAAAVARQGADRLDWGYVDALPGDLALLKEAPHLLPRLHRLRDAARKLPA